MKFVSLAIKGFFSATLLSSSLALADVPAGKEALVIDTVPGDKGAVTLQHAKHVKEHKKKGGVAITCKDCHHSLKTADGAGEKITACQECHVKTGEPKTIDGKKAIPMFTLKNNKPEMNSIIYHKNCKDGCHKEMKAEGKNITVCKTCHAK